MKVGDIVVNYPWPHLEYRFYRIKKQTTKMVILEQLKDINKSGYTLDYTPGWEYEHIRLTNEVIGSRRVKKETLFSDFEVYNPNKKYYNQRWDD